MTYESLLINPAIQALGRSLLHFLWQGTLLAMILGTVYAWAGKSRDRQTSAKIRYGAACLVMLLMPVSLIVTVVESYPSPTVPISIVEGAPGPLNVPAHASLPAISTPIGGIGVPGWVVFVWFAGVVILSGRAAGGWIRAQILKRKGCGVVTAELIEAFEQLKQRLQVARPVRLCASALAKTPVVIGWIRPYILLPVTAVSGLDEAQLHSILAHELAHIRRHDYLINLLQTAVETLLFYHPAVWWVGRTMRVERENCCDDLAIEVCGDVAGYARALAQLEQLRIGTPQPAMAVNGGQLLGRIRRLLEEEQSKHPAPKSLGAILSAFVVLAIVATPMMWSSSAVPESQQPANVEKETIPSQAVPAAEQPPESRQNRFQEAPRERGAGNGQGNGAGNGLGNGVRDLFDAGTAAEFKRTVGEFRRSIEEYRRLAPSIFGRPEGGAERGPSAQSTEMLIKLFDSSKDMDLKRQILDYLGSSGNPQAAEKLRAVAQSDAEPELRRHATEYILSKADAASLIKLYDESREPDLKAQIMDFLGSSDNQQAIDKLLSIARSDAEPQLRRHAIDYIASKPKSFDTLVTLYDNSREPEIKRHILDYLGSSTDPRALDKLFAIAQSDPDRELRRAAVDYIAAR